MATSDLKRWDPSHPEYGAWMIGKLVTLAATGRLLHALVCRDVRAELYRRYRAERCNPPEAYTDGTDRKFSDAIADELEGRIDR